MSFSGGGGDSDHRRRLFHYDLFIVRHAAFFTYTFTI
jgi:hypothetical protein